MEFNPNNSIVKLCLQGMSLEEKRSNQEAKEIFLRAWNESSNDFEKYLAAYYLARHQDNIGDKLKWLETCLTLALKINDESVNGALPSLYLNIAKSQEELGDNENAKKNFMAASLFKNNPSDKGPFYHGTRADLQIGDLLTAGNRSNYKNDLVMNHIYFTAVINGAGLAAALSKGDGRERIYIVEPTGEFENDPNVTDKKFPGNPTRSYRTTEPLKIVGELNEWVSISPDEIKKWREKLANNSGEIIN